MKNFKYISLIILFSFLLMACGENKITETPGITVIVQTLNTTAYPGPAGEPTMPVIDSAYPGPLEGSGSPELASTPEYFVNELVVATPESGKANITGQLLVGGEGGQPYIATLYLASTIPASNPDYPPLIAFSEKSDPIAIQEVSTGRFLFTNINPGQYAIIVWTPFGGNPLVDESETEIIFTVNPDEVKDLGMIPIQ